MEKQKIVNWLLSEDPALLQVGFREGDRQLDGIQEFRRALNGSAYSLEVDQTVLNDGIAMIQVTDDEAGRLMDEGEIELPSGCVMVIDSY
jgi:hypothetical protein